VTPEFALEANQCSKNEREGHAAEERQLVIRAHAG